MRVPIVPLLLLASCSTTTSALIPKGICLNKTMTKAGAVHEGALLQITQEACVEEMQKYCANAADAQGEVYCSMYWRIGGPGSAASPIEDREPAPAPEEDREGYYDDV